MAAPSSPTPRARRLPLLLAAAALMAGCAGEHEEMVHVIAETAHGLKNGARVQYRGIDVGFVKQVYFTPGGVRIDLLIQREGTPIRTQDTVRIVPAGAFGQQRVDIAPGVQTAPLIAKGGSLPPVRPESTVAVPVGVFRAIVTTLNTVIERDSTGTIRVRADSAGLRAAGMVWDDTLGTPGPLGRVRPGGAGGATAAQPAPPNPRP